MKQKSKALLPAVLFLYVFFLCSCSGGLLWREVEVQIPSHPWEDATGSLLWMELRVVYPDYEERTFVRTNQRTLRIKVPLGKAVVVLVYPLGNLSPFGGWISPATGDLAITLSQREGVLLDAVTRLEARNYSDLNFPLILETIAGKCDDYREIETIQLLQDIANGELSEKSIVLQEKFTCTDLSIPSGIWYGEMSLDGRLFSSSSQDPVVSMYPGVLRYYNYHRQLQLVLHMDDQGVCDYTIGGLHW